MKHLLALAIPCALAAAYAAPAHAEDTDDRFQIRLGAMNVDNDNTIRGNTLLAGNNVSVNEDFKLGGKGMGATRGRRVPHQHPPALDSSTTSSTTRIAARPCHRM